MLKPVPMFQTKPSAAARLNNKFSTTAVSLRCFKVSKVTLAFPPPSGSTANFVRLFIRSFVLTDNSWNGKNEHKASHQMGFTEMSRNNEALDKIKTNTYWWGFSEIMKQKKNKCNITLEIHSLKVVNQLATLQAWPATSLNWVKSGPL